MIHEIITQHVAPDKRDEYIQVFGEFLTKANYPGSHRIKFFASIEDPEPRDPDGGMGQRRSPYAHPRHTDPQCDAGTRRQTIKRPKATAGIFFCMRLNK